MAETKIDFNDAVKLIQNGQCPDISKLNFNINEARSVFIGFYQESHDSSQNENKFCIYEIKTLLHVAIQAGNINAIKKLLNNGADLKIPVTIEHGREQRELRSGNANSLGAQWSDWSFHIENTIIKTSQELVAELAKEEKFDAICDIVNIKLGLPVDEDELIDAFSSKTKFRNLKLYPFSDQNDAKKTENSFQEQVNDRFFRQGEFNKSLKKNSKASLLVTQIENIIGAKTNNKINDKILKNLSFKGNHQQTQVINFYLKNLINLEDFSSRFVILALITILNKYGHIPTLVFKIGNHHFLSIDQSSSNQKGNVNLQAINANGTIKFVPSVYGQGNKSPQHSIANRLKNIQTKKADILKLMKIKSHKIASLSTPEISDDDGFFLDKVNFLRSIIEVARRGYYKTQRSELDKLPMGIAQARTSQLLIDNKISIDDAYGLDDNEKFYTSKEILDIHDYEKQSPSKTSPKEKYKAPYGAATGKGLEEDHKEVQNKIERINSEYNNQYKSDQGAFLIEGRNLMRERLGEEYGSDAESSGADYSDEEVDAIKKVKPLQYDKQTGNIFFKPASSSKTINPKYRIYQETQKILANLSFFNYKSYQFNFTIENATINSFLNSLGLQRGEATKDGNNCLLHSYFQNIQKFFNTNYPGQFVLLDQDFQDFIDSIRDALSKTKGEMLSANDETEGVQILTAIQAYLQTKFNNRFGFSLEIFFADSDGDVGIVDNLDQLQLQTPQGGITIPLQIIQVNYNHYEPVFVMPNAPVLNAAQLPKLS